MHEILPQCHIIDIRPDIDPEMMLDKVYRIISAESIDLVVTYGFGYFFAHQLNCAKIFVNPKLYISEGLMQAASVRNNSQLFPQGKELNDAIITRYKKIEDKQFDQITLDGDFSTAIIALDCNSEKRNIDVITEHLGVIPRFYYCEKDFSELIWEHVIPTMAGFVAKGGIKKKNYHPEADLMSWISKYWHFDNVL